MLSIVLVHECRRGRGGDSIEELYSLSDTSLESRVVRRRERSIGSVRMAGDSIGHAGFWSGLVKEFFVVSDLFPQLLDRVLEKSTAYLLQTVL